MQKIIDNLRLKSKFHLGLLLLIIIAILVVFILHLSFNSQSNFLKVSFLNIGQGDAIYIKAPNGTEIIMDGGPDQKLLSELGKQMSFMDKSIQMIIVTNPDKDHYAGFIDLLEKYKIVELIEPGTISGTPTFHAFKEKISQKEVTQRIVRTGDRIILDDKRNIYLEILYPDRDVTNFSSNDGSIVSKLVYGETCLLLQGDATEKVESRILELYSKEDLHCRLIKAGHHGSRTSSSRNYLETVQPEFAILSLGKNNRYGHPHKEVLDNMNDLKIKILRTDIDGTISFTSNGKEWIKK